MRNEVQINRLMSLENAIFACFGRDFENELPQVESAEDAVIDALQEHDSLPRNEAECQFRKQIQ